MDMTVDSGHAKTVPEFMQQGVFLFRFGEKDHLDLMRRTGVLRWGDPRSYDEPPRPQLDVAIRGELRKEIEYSTFIFCCSGFLGKDRRQLMDSALWPKLDRLVNIMCDQSRCIVRPYVMPILDAGQFLGALSWSYITAPSNLQRCDSEGVISCGVTTATHQVECTFVNYDGNPSLSEFNVKAEDRDESEFRIVGKSDISFTWDSVRQNWYPVYIPPAILQNITGTPVPAECLYDATWRRKLIEQMHTECFDWQNYKGKYNLDTLNEVASMMKEIPKSMWSPCSILQ